MKSTLKLLFVLAVAFTLYGPASAVVLPDVFSASESMKSPRQDSLRVDTVLGSMNALISQLQKDILPKLAGPSKNSTTLLTDSLKKAVKKAELEMKNKKLTFNRLNEKEKKLFQKMESYVSKMLKNIPGKSEEFQPVAKMYIAIYKATQEMTANSKKPLLATYSEPYDPNVSRNHQVMILGAYMNFYLEYRITVGGIEMGPDIVDADRIVFTFPDKLLQSLETPDYIEIKASPKMQTGSGKTAKTADYMEQTVYLLVYPLKK